jgi:hypothetical protein
MSLLGLSTVQPVVAQRLFRVEVCVTFVALCVALIYDTLSSYLNDNILFESKKFPKNSSGR